MRSLLLEGRSSFSSIKCSSLDSGETDNKLSRLLNNYDNVFRLHPGPLPEQYRTLLNQMPTKEKKKHKKNKKHRGGDTPAGDDKTEEERRERKKHKKRDHDSDGGAAKKKKKEKKKKSRREDKDL